MAPMSAAVKSALDELQTKSFPNSDYHMGRNLSFLVKLGWDQDTLEHRAKGNASGFESGLAQGH